MSSDSITDLGRSFLALFWCFYWHIFQVPRCMTFFFFCNSRNVMKLFRVTWIHITGPYSLIFGSRINLYFLWGESSDFHGHFIHSPLRLWYFVVSLVGNYNSLSGFAQSFIQHVSSCCCVWGLGVGRAGQQRDSLSNENSCPCFSFLTVLALFYLCF